MGMRDIDLYSRLLDISEPWSVSLVEIDTPNKSVTVTVCLDATAPLTCPHCGRVSPRYDSRRRSWRHLDTMQFQTMLEADIPRVTCGDHGVVQLPVPWAEPGSRFTAMFSALVIDWLRVAAANAVAMIRRSICLEKGGAVLVMQLCRCEPYRQKVLPQS